jgi:hypothetical protein
MRGSVQSQMSIVLYRQLSSIKEIHDPPHGVIGNENLQNRYFLSLMDALSPSGRVNVCFSIVG